MSKLVSVPKIIAACPECGGTILWDDGAIYCKRSFDSLKHDPEITTLCIRYSPMWKEVRTMVDAWVDANDVGKASQWKS